MTSFFYKGSVHEWNENLLILERIAMRFNPIASEFVLLPKLGTIERNFVPYLGRGKGAGETHFLEENKTGIL